MTFKTHSEIDICVNYYIYLYEDIRSSTLTGKWDFVTPATGSGQSQEWKSLV